MAKPLRPGERGRVVNIRTLTEVVRAAHLTQYVESPFPERGGMIFVSPPQQLKSSIIKCLKVFGDAFVISDLNAQKLNELREDLSTGRYTTVAFLEFNKLYQRNPISAANLEGTLQALIAEGWRGSSHDDPRMATTEARCLMIGGMTSNTYESRYKGWKDGGFLQRILWCHYMLRDPKSIGDAIEHQEPIDLGGEVWALPGAPIHFALDDAERKEIRKMIQAQASETIPFSLLLKIACVLKWHYGKSPKTRGGNMHMRTLHEFARMLQNKYALLEVSE